MMECHYGIKSVSVLLRILARSRIPENNPAVGFYLNFLIKVRSSLHSPPDICCNESAEKHKSALGIHTSSIIVTRPAQRSCTWSRVDSMLGRLTLLRTSYIHLLCFICTVQNLAAPPPLSIFNTFWAYWTTEFWWLIPRRRGLLGRLMVNSCTLVGDCRDRFWMCTPYCTLYVRRFGVRIIGMLFAPLSSSLSLYLN